MTKPVGVIAWIALSIVVPGAAHLRAGRRVLGLTLLGAYLLLLTTALVIYLRSDAGTAGLMIDHLRLIAAGASALAVLWVALIAHSYLVLRPGRLSVAGRVCTGVAAATLAVLVTLPFGLTARVATVSQRTLDRVFTAPSAPIKPEDPWDGRERVNVLLLGGDWDNGRIGIRTDSVNVASVDVKTGATVLIGLPRNLEHVRFPPGTPMRQRFPSGFRLPTQPGGGRDDLLFGVWEYADQHPELFGGKKHMGAEVLKQTVGHTLGLKIDWYTLVNIWGFAKIVDALGGLVLTVDRNVVFGRNNEGLVKAGTRRLNGTSALWYARSRTYTDDYTRMRRQRCVFSALLSQADPATVLTRFTKVAKATRNMIRTDVPQPMLAHLVPLAAKVKKATVTSVQFMPPMINTAAPDWRLIRKTTATALVAPAPSAKKKTSKISEGCGGL